MNRSKESLEKQKKTRIIRGLNKGTDRQSLAFRNWRDEVKKRDNFKCSRCDETKFLHPHHIKPWKDYPNLRFDINNGITLCASCHAKEEGFQKGHKAWATGKKFTEQHKQKLRNAKIGKPSNRKGIKTNKAAWNKGLKTGKPAWNSGKKGLQIAHNKGKKCIIDPETGKRIWIEKDKQ